MSSKCIVCKHFFNAQRVLGVKWHELSWKEATKEEPGLYFKKFMAEESNKASKSMKSPRKRRRSNAPAGKQDYGPFADQPPMSQMELKQSCDDKLRDVMVFYILCICI